MERHFVLLLLFSGLAYGKPGYDFINPVNIDVILPEFEGLVYDIPNNYSIGGIDVPCSLDALEQWLTQLGLQSPVFALKEDLVLTKQQQEEAGLENQLEESEGNVLAQVDTSKGVPESLKSATGEDIDDSDEEVVEYHSPAVLRINREGLLNPHTDYQLVLESLEATEGRVLVVVSSAGNHSTCGLGGFLGDSTNGSNHFTRSDEDAPGGSTDEGVTDNYVNELEAHEDDFLNRSHQAHDSSKEDNSYLRVDDLCFQWAQGLLQGGGEGVVIFTPPECGCVTISAFFVSVNQTLVVGPEASPRNLQLLLCVDPNAKPTDNDSDDCDGDLHESLIVKHEGDDGSAATVEDGTPDNVINDLENYFEEGSEKKGFKGKGIDKSTKRARQLARNRARLERRKKWRNQLQQARWKYPGRGKVRHTHPLQEEEQTEVSFNAKTHWRNHRKLMQKERKKKRIVAKEERNKKRAERKNALQERKKARREQRKNWKKSKNRAKKQGRKHLEYSEYDYDFDTPNKAATNNASISVVTSDVSVTSTSDVSVTSTSDVSVTSEEDGVIDADENQRSDEITDLAQETEDDHAVEAILEESTEEGAGEVVEEGEEEEEHDDEEDRGLGHQDLVKGRERSNRKDLNWTPRKVFRKNMRKEVSQGVKFCCKQGIRHKKFVRGFNEVSKGQVDSCSQTPVEVLVWVVNRFNTLEEVCNTHYEICCIKFNMAWWKMQQTNKAAKKQSIESSTTLTTSTPMESMVQEK